MYVCICNGITDGAIREAASRGVTNLQELAAITGCGAVCGSCGELAGEILAEALRTREFPLPLLAA